MISASVHYKWLFTTLIAVQYQGQLSIARQSLQTKMQSFRTHDKTFWSSIRCAATVGEAADWSAEKLGQAPCKALDIAA